MPCKSFHFRGQEWVEWHLSYFRSPDHLVTFRTRRVIKLEGTNNLSALGLINMTWLLRLSQMKYIYYAQALPIHSLDRP